MHRGRSGGFVTRTVPLIVYGERLASAPEVQLVVNPAPKQAIPPIEIDRFCRNQQCPNATLQNQINMSANAAALYRSKQICAFGDTLRTGAGTHVQILSAGAGDRARWRFAFRTGPYTHALYCIVVMAPQSSGFTSNSYGRLDIATNAAGTPAVLSQTFEFGNHPTNGTVSGGWPNFRVIKNFIDAVSPDTEYYGTFYDVADARILSVCIFDLQSLTEHFDGYLAQNTTTHTPILDLHRELPVTISNALWQKGGSQVFNWSVNNGTTPITTTSATATNIIDTTSTAVSSATPGYPLDMTDKDRLASGGVVPCVMKMFGKQASAGTGSVVLKDSAGSTIATCSTTATTNGWTSTTFNLPATVDKYDVQFKSTDVNGFDLYAVSVYEYG